MFEGKINVSLWGVFLNSPSKWLIFYSSRVFFLLWKRDQNLDWQTLKTQ